MLNITQENNFCRVFAIPQKFPENFCFGGGHLIPFTMVDWFNPVPSIDIYNNEIKPWEEYSSILKDFLKNKIYVKYGWKYLVITDFDESFIFSKNA